MNILFNHLYIARSLQIARVGFDRRLRFKGSYDRLVSMNKFKFINVATIIGSMSIEYFSIEYDLSILFEIYRYQDRHGEEK